MALTKCAKCGHDIANDISVCPACGARLGRGIQARGIRLVGLILVCALAGLILARFIQNREPVAPVVENPPTTPVSDLKETRTKAEAGDAGAQLLVGEMYLKGNGAPQDYKEAAKWFRLAADQGNAMAQTYVAQLYEAGRGVPLDEAEAAKWFLKAAEQGNSGAQYNLASMYIRGRGVTPNDAKAAKWYREAADRGDSLAQYNIGQRSIIGLGVPKDPIEAFKWLSLAAAQGENDAVQARDELKKNMSSGQLSEGQRRAQSLVPKKQTASGQ